MYGTLSVSAICCATVLLPQPAGPVTSQMWWCLGAGLPLLVAFDTLGVIIVLSGFGSDPKEFMLEAMFGGAGVGAPFSDILWS